MISQSVLMLPRDIGAAAVLLVRFFKLEPIDVAFFSLLEAGRRMMRYLAQGLRS
jgi:hypothetical protein